MTGEHLPADIQELLALFQRYEVRYLLVGGEAVIHHGYPRLTGDVDFFYDRSPANARRLFRALADFWGGHVPAVGSADELAEPDVILQYGRPPNRIDLISTLGTVTFGRAWRRRVVDRLRGRRPAVLVHIIGLPDLLRSKRDAGRHKDLEDVEALTAVAARHPGQEPKSRRPQPSKLPRARKR
ncbi:MAG: hypothetical protein HY908_01800 [Myxococcales bacterium]|nr:hypothetical protein [Myxococcales bacterium]